MSKKIKIISIFLILVIFLLIMVTLIEKSSNIPKYKSKISNLSLNYFLKLPDIVKSSLFILSGKKSFSNLFNDYNVKFLPSTQLLDLDFFRIKTNFQNKDSFKFFIEIYENELILTNKFGEFLRINIDNLNKEKKKSFKKIKIENLPKENGPILDTLIIGNQIFISKISNYKSCGKLEIYNAEIKEILNFKIFKSFDECKSIKIGAGRLAKYILNGQEGILITTNDSDNDDPGKKAQDENSIFGKIVFINKVTKNHKIISKGHRNAQGIFVKDDIILSTEHGPKGGDELNKIVFGKNYGWPISSYGNSYKNEKLKYIESHKQNSFEEPLYVFMPSIGISELIILPNEFNSKWKNSVLISSLNGRSIYRIKFEDQNFDKVIYHEKIFIGERIRDIKYLKKSKYLILALERTGDIGLLANKYNN